MPPSATKAQHHDDRLGAAARRQRGGQQPDEGGQRDGAWGARETSKEGASPSPTCRPHTRGVEACRKFAKPWPPGQPEGRGAERPDRPPEARTRAIPRGRYLGLVSPPCPAPFPCIAATAPRTFADVVGQGGTWVRTLRNAVEQGKVHHANLFVGFARHGQDPRWPRSSPPA